MRKTSMVALVGVLLGVQGCQLAIPGSLINTAGGPGGNPTVRGGEDCRALFFKLDLNGDKSLTVEEYLKGRTGQAAPAPQTEKPPTRDDRKALMSVEDDLRAGFKAMDGDGDGKVSQTEFLASCEGEGEVEDIAKIMPKPGVMPGYEPPVMPGTPWPLNVDCYTAFKNADQNADGKWDREEYARFAEKWPLALHDCGPVRSEPMPEPHLVDPAVAPDGGLISNEVGTMIGSTTPDGPVSAIAPAPCPEPFIPFEKLDADGSGSIDAEELCAAFGDPGVAPPPPVDGCKMTFQNADQNGDGAVSPEEYMRADFSPPLPDGMAAATVMPSDETLKRRFLTLDRNQDGKLTPEEFCADWGVAVPPQPPSDECSVRFKPMDINGDGGISWEEYYTRLTMNMGAFASDADAARFKDEQYRRFKAMDHNADQVLSPVEFCSDVVIDPNEPQPVPGDCEGTYKAFDQDGSGALSFDEYASGRYGEIRFVQAPTREEAARMIDEFKAKARSLDGNQDLKLSYEEFKRSCVE